MSGDDLADRVARVVREADGPVSLGTVQRRVARTGRDVARSALRETCEELVAAGRLRQVGDPPRRRYAPLEES